MPTDKSDARKRAREAASSWRGRVLADWQEGRADAAITKLVVAVAALKEDSHPPVPIAAPKQATPTDEDVLGAFGDAVTLLAAVRATASDLDLWAQSADHFHKQAGIEIRKLNNLIKARSAPGSGVGDLK